MENQLGRDEAIECCLQLVLGQAGNGEKHPVGKVASNRGADLRRVPCRLQAG
jgi:hypothetical protein